MSTFHGKKDPDSEDVDTFTLRWKREHFYAFPPFSIILKVLRKIKMDKSEGLLIIPDWPSQPWYTRGLRFCPIERYSYIDLNV